jgi:hypothetical protein
LDRGFGVTVGVGNVPAVDALVILEDKAVAGIAGYCQQSGCGSISFFFNYLRVNLKILCSS